jgi:hypothetical protein
VITAFGATVDSPPRALGRHICNCWGMGRAKISLLRVPFLMSFDTPAASDVRGGATSPLLTMHALTGTMAM